MFGLMVRALSVSAILSLCPLYGLAPFGSSNPCTEQNATPPSRQVRVRLDSGLVQNNTDGEQAIVVFSQSIEVTGAQWLRLQFEDVVLAGDSADHNASFLRLTSAKDGAIQLMRSTHVEEWVNTSAYFNGDEVLVEILAFPGTGDNRVSISQVTAGQAPVQPVSICLGVDDRTLSTDPRSGRHLPEGCTAWMHDDLNKTFMAAGHCGVSAGDVVQFNVPLSNANGSLNHPPPSDQYVVDGSSVQAQNGGIGNDWAYFGTNTNSTTGLSAFQVQGQAYVKSSSAPAVAGQTIRITGYGTVSSPVSPTWQQVQKTHSGPYISMIGTTVRYRVDTTGGNSGSAVQNLDNNTIIGIHTHAGCTSTGGSNQGTAIHHTNLQNALNNPLGICRSGRMPVSPPLYASGDANNNFGTVNTSNGGFGKVSEVKAVMQGLAPNRNTGQMYGSSSGGALYSIVPSTGVATLIGPITGTTQVMNGLAYDPNSNTLYGIAQATGQLFTIDTSTGAAATVGPARGNTVGALDYDPVGNKIYGLDDSGGATKLITIDPTDGAQTIVGALGIGISDCNGLAWNDRDNQLYTINATTDQLLRVSPVTGIATVVGGTNGLFGAGYGMAVAMVSSFNLSPTSFGVLLGNTLSGGLPQLLSGDDSYLVVQSSLTRSRQLPAVQIEVRTTAPVTTLSQLKFRLEARTDAVPAGDVGQRIELFNYTTNTWELVDSRGATSTDSIAEPTVSGNPSRFVHPTSREMRARLSWFDAPSLTSRSWTVSVDETSWSGQF